MGLFESELLQERKRHGQAEINSLLAYERERRRQEGKVISEERESPGKPKTIRLGHG